MGCGGSKNADAVKVQEAKKDKEPPPSKSPQDKKTRSVATGGEGASPRDGTHHTDGASSETNKKKIGKRELLRQELLAATESRDIGRLEKAIADYERAHMPNQADLARARRVLVALHEEELRAAMEDNNLDALEAAIEAANKSEVLPELHEGETLKEAEELRSLLRRLKLYLHKVLELKPMTVSEIHSYQRPRPLVHTVMKATYMLLGEKERQLQAWEYIQSLLRRQGRGSIIRRIKEYDPQHMRRAKMDRAEGHLRVCSKEKVRQTSAGASTFYVWSYNIIHEGKSMNKEET